MNNSFRKTCMTVIFFFVLSLFHVVAIPTGVSGSEENHVQGQREHEEEGHEEEGHEDDDHEDDDHEDDGHKEDEHGHSGEADHDDEREEKLELTEKQKKDIGLTMQKAGSASLHSEVALSGEILLNEDAVVHVVPRVAGIAVKTTHTVGDKVQAGEVLAVLESADLGEAKIEFFEHHKEVQFAKEDMDRVTTVHGNTKLLLGFLEEQPTLDALRQKEFGDLGEFRSRLIMSYTELVVSRKAYERKKTLFDEKIASENSLLEAQNNFEKAQAEYLTELDNVRFENRQNLLEKERAYQLAVMNEESAARRLRILSVGEEEIESLHEIGLGSKLGAGLTRAEIAAPQGGIIIEKHIGRGEKVGDDTEIFSIADLSSVWVDLKVPARDMHLVRAGMEVIMEAPDGDREIGVITVTMPLMDVETRAGTVRAVMANQDGEWKPGAFVTGHVRISADNVPVVVPLEALQALEGKEVLFVEEDGAYVPIPVVTGRRDRDSVEVKSGLKRGEAFVAKGAFELKAMMVTSGLGSHAGHGH